MSAVLDLKSGICTSCYIGEDKAVDTEVAETGCEESAAKDGVEGGTRVIADSKEDFDIRSGVTELNCLILMSIYFQKLSRALQNNCSCRSNICKMDLLVTVPLVGENAAREAEGVSNPPHGKFPCVFSSAPRDGGLRTSKCAAASGRSARREEVVNFILWMAVYYTGGVVN